MFTASLQELVDTIDNAGTIPNLRAGGAAEDVFLSFGLFNSQPNDEGFESVLNEANAGTLFDQLRLTFQNNGETLRKIARMACILDVIESDRPADVTENVEVTLGGVRLNRSTGFFVGTARLTNSLGVTLAAPISVVVELQGVVQLANADGRTCGTSPAGGEFVNFDMELGPGESAEVELIFENPDREEIHMAAKILSGPGAR